LPSDPPLKRGRYHHGDLKEALVDATIVLIAERGVRNFSLAEVSRRLGVTVAAPYRHFKNRDGLLAAVAVRALGVFAASLAATARETDDPAQRLAAMGRAYIRFAAEQRPLFAVVNDSGLDKHRHPDLARAYEAVDRVYHDAVRAVCGPDEAAAEALGQVLEVTAYGFAMYLTDGDFGTGPDVVEQTAERAARAALALIAGREVLTSS
jgi:AcrR family transcriptional regulator